MTQEADTIWQPLPPVPTEFATVTSSDIADPSAVLLVDPSAVQIEDTGLTSTQIDATVWSNSPGN